MKFPIVLTSTSPRRKQLLEWAGLDFQIIAPTSEEIERTGESPQKMVQRLAREKVHSVASAQLFARPTVLIGADTTVVAPGGKAVLNKPLNLKDATRMLNLIQGTTHTVLTGYHLAVWKKDKCLGTVSRVVRTLVTLRKLDSKAVAHYLACGESMDKAGAYGAQGQGMALIQKITGSYTNVVGLPVAELLIDLRKISK